MADKLSTGCNKTFRSSCVFCKHTSGWTGVAVGVVHPFVQAARVCCLAPVLMLLPLTWATGWKSSVCDALLAYKWYLQSPRQCPR